MRYLSIFGLLLLLVTWSSCRKDFDTEPSTGQLKFSLDTVYLDTIFTTIASPTYSFKVYNTSDNDISVPSIRLQKGASSDYRLNVNGIPGKNFNNTTIFANDSIFIFVETTSDIKDNSANAKEFLYTDQVLFDTGGNQQEVALVTLIKDAVFLYPRTLSNAGIKETLTIGAGEDSFEIEGFFLDTDELTFTNDKPYVIYGYAAVPSGNTLTVNAGARLHFHENSGLIVAPNASLVVNGLPSTDPEKPFENQVVFAGDRINSGTIFNEEKGSDFENLPGQWNAIWLTQGSTANEINYATILNATVGIQMDSNDGTANPTLTINNSQIYNSTAFGINATTANIKAENLVINNSGISSLRCLLGGTYDFNHCTFANYWQSGREFPTVQIGNNFAANNIEVIENLEAANFTNCIIYGNQQAELTFSRNKEKAFNVNFKNCLIRSELSPSQIPMGDEDLYDFSDTTIYQNCILNESPDFKDSSENDFQIGENSAGNGKAASPGIGMDINGIARDTQAPDIGAYESIDISSDD